AHQANQTGAPELQRCAHRHVAYLIRRSDSKDRVICSPRSGPKDLTQTSWPCAQDRPLYRELACTSRQRHGRASSRRADRLVILPTLLSESPDATKNPTSPPSFAPDNPLPHNELLPPLRPSRSRRHKQDISLGSETASLFPFVCFQ